MKKEKIEHYYNTILDSIADGVFTIDNDKKITSFNKAAENITGIKREIAIGKNCYEIFRTNVCSKDCSLEKTMETGNNIIDRSINIIDKSGNRIPVSISTALMKNDNGEIIGGVETFRDLSELEQLRKEIKKQYSFNDIISKNHKIHEIINILPDIAESDSTVLIEGPSGSGKELFARAIHNLSNRKNKPLVVINCGALPDSLLESELFGYVKGAFTDAKKDKPGRFALANGGTLFLDEIGDVSPALQVRLLRVLQEHEYEPLGGITPIKTDVRIIAATNKNLLELVNKKIFRDDLYYRLNVIKIELLPLSKRKEDIPLLVQHFIQKFNASKNKNIRGITDKALAALTKYDFPGNIRELENIIERAFVLCRDKEITISDIPENIITQNNSTKMLDNSNNNNTFKDAEVDVIIKTLEDNNWNKLATAKKLGINKSTLWRKMKKYNINKI